MNSVTYLRDAWHTLGKEDRAASFCLLDREAAEAYFYELDTNHQAELILALPKGEQRAWMRLLAPDDAADVVQAVDPEARDSLLHLLDHANRKEILALMAYAEDHAGGLMNPRFARVRPDMSVDAAIRYLRRQTDTWASAMHYVYVLGPQQHLLGVVSFRNLFMAQSTKDVCDIMHPEPVTIHEQMDQEAVSRLFAAHSLMAMPVVDDEGHMKGVVTVDDIVDVVNEEATEDIQKFGGMEALKQPYLQTSLPAMIKKRAGWLSALFIGEMLTATALGFYENEIAKAVVLALFMPLIISSGGNSGSQASTLVVRSMALGEVRLIDFWRVIRREITTGIALGSILGSIGLLRVLTVGSFSDTYGKYYKLLAMVVALSLVGVVMFGTIAGAVLPFLMRRLGFDPASASAPFVATLVDVTGLIIYFTVAQLFLHGTLL